MASSAKRHRTIMLIICCGLCITLMIFTMNMGRRAVDGMLHFRGTVLPVTSLNGFFDALVTLVCVIMVIIENKRGSVLALIMLGLSMLPAVTPILFAGNFAPLPSVINTAIMMVIIVLLRKIFARRERESATDYLTGLLNRRGLMKELYDKDEDDKYYFMYIDIDDFKFINDNLGHKCGDQVLVTLSARMLEIAQRTGKDNLVSRIGGDEFVMIVNGDADMDKLSEEVINAISSLIIVDSENNPAKCYVSACVGYSAHPSDSTDPQTIMKYADIAMYQAKSSGKNKCCPFDKEMEAKILRQAELEGIIKEGLDSDRFYLVYQPQYHTQNKKLRGFETLLRLKTEDGTFVSPAEFIPAAEKTDLILRVDEYVIKRAMKEFGSVVRKCNENIMVSINVSAKNICRYGFADMVKQAAEEADFPFGCLEIEITEYCLVQSLETAIYNIDCLKKLGVQIALDDFGTGYASLSYLSKLSVDLLKIDKSFIDEIDKDEKSNDFISAVISIGHIHDCKVISEGVEHENQLKLLLEQGCDFIQGYIWSKPLPYRDAVILSEQCSIWIE